MESEERRRERLSR